MAQLLAEERGVRNLANLSDLTIKQILKWADAHHKKTGQWPKVKSGSVPGTLGERWNAIDIALTRGLRGLPNGSSLAKLLSEIKTGDKVVTSGGIHGVVTNVKDKQFTLRIAEGKMEVDKASVVRVTEKGSGSES